MAGSWPSLIWDEFATLCKKYGKTLHSGDLPGALVLAAIGGNESTYGMNCKPRHEIGYCTGCYSGNHEIIALTEKWNHAAHCSFGPFQLLLCNADGADPEQFRDAEFGFARSVAFMNHQADRMKPKTLKDWGEIWNGGHIGAFAPGVAKYCTQLQVFYDLALHRGM